jgi:hypothetical protein
VRGRAGAWAAPEILVGEVKTLCSGRLQVDGPGALHVGSGVNVKRNLAEQHCPNACGDCTLSFYPAVHRPQSEATAVNVIAASADA